MGRPGKYLDLTAFLSLPEWQKVSIAIGVSLLFHIFLFLLLVIGSAFSGAFHNEPVVEKEKPLEIIISPQLQKAIQVLKPVSAEKKIVVADGLQKTKEAPKNAMFESDENSRAASLSPAKGAIPLPSQEGKELPGEQFKKQAYSAAKKDASVAAVAPQTQKPSIQPERANVPTPVPQFLKPTPLITDLNPPQSRLVPKPKKPEPTALPEIRKAETKPVEPQLAAIQPTPLPQPPEKSSTYQPETIPNKIEGSITNRGSAGIDAIQTPMGKFNKNLADAIGSRWHFYMQQQPELVTLGTVKIRFWIDREGKATDMEIVSNSSNDSLATVSMRSITEAELPPLPPEVVDQLKDGRYEVVYTFTFF